MAAPKGHPPYPGCEKGGCPKTHTKEFIDNEADAFMEWMKLPDSLYTKRFAISRGYLPQRMYEWAKHNQKFREVLLYAKEWQEARLAEGGMKNELNSGFTRFVMSNVCGWSEKQSTEISGSAQSPLRVIYSQLVDQQKDLVDEQNSD